MQADHFGEAFLCDALTRPLATDAGTQGL